jgi:hypothetical protein
MSQSNSAELAFVYFPGDYRWSMGLMLGLGSAPWGGAEIDEINRIGQRLRDKLGDDRAWVAEWTRMARIVEHRGRASRHDRTRAACLFRAAHYYHLGERFLQP